MRKDFVFQNFEPRTGVKTFANQRLKDLLSDLDGQFVCKALVSQKENGFSFSVVLGREGKMYSTDSFVSYVKCLNSGREWQSKEVERLLHDLEMQVLQWSTLQQSQ